MPDPPALRTGVLPVPPLDPVDAAVANVVSPKTKEVYLRHIRGFLTDLEALFGIGPHEANYDHLLRWWSWLREREDSLGRRLGPSAINGRVAAVKRFYREGVRREFFPSNPAEGVPSLRVSKQPKGRALLPDEARALLEACPWDGTLLDFRDRVALTLLLLTGARSSEAIALRVEDFREDLGVRVVTFQRKGGLSDQQKVTAELALLLDAWLHRASLGTGALLRALVPMGGGRYVIRPGPLSARTLHRIVKGRGAAAGLGDDVGPHDLRRTWITAADEMGVKLTKLSRSAGHADPATTMAYIHHRDLLVDHPSDAVAKWLAKKEQDDLS